MGAMRAGPQNVPNSLTYPKGCRLFMSVYCMASSNVFCCVCVWFAGPKTTTSTCHASGNAQMELNGPGHRHGPFMLEGGHWGLGLGLSKDCARASKHYPLLEVSENQAYIFLLRSGRSDLAAIVPDQATCPFCHMLKR